MECQDRYTKVAKQEQRSSQLYAAWLAKQAAAKDGPSGTGKHGGKSSGKGNSKTPAPATGVAKLKQDDQKNAAWEAGYLLEAMKKLVKGQGKGKGKGPPAAPGPTTPTTPQPESVWTCKECGTGHHNSKKAHCRVCGLAQGLKPANRPKPEVEAPPSDLAAPPVQGETALASEPKALSAKKTKQHNFLAEVERRQREAEAKAKPAEAGDQDIELDSCCSGKSYSSAPTGTVENLLHKLEMAKQASEPQMVIEAWESAVLAAQAQATKDAACRETPFDLGTSESFLTLFLGETQRDHSHAEKRLLKDKEELATQVAELAAKQAANAEAIAAEKVKFETLQNRITLAKTRLPLVAAQAAQETPAPAGTPPQPAGVGPAAAKKRRTEAPAPPASAFVVTMEEWKDALAAHYTEASALSDLDPVTQTKFKAMFDSISDHLTQQSRPAAQLCGQGPSQEVGDSNDYPWGDDEEDDM